MKTQNSTLSGSKKMNLLLWTVQGLLAAVYLMAGFNKMLMSMDELVKMMPWAAAASETMVRCIGFIEVAGALGLLLPVALNIKPGLTAYAAAGLTLIQVFAALFHLSRGEFPLIAFNLFLAALAYFVFRGRRTYAALAG